MRRIVVALSALSTAFFAVFFAYTFVAREHLASLALEFAARKTEEHVEPAVKLAEQAIESKTAAKLLGEDKVASVRRELADYRRDPTGYIATLTRKRLSDARIEEQGPIAAKAFGWKRKIEKFFAARLQALVADLRIFAGSNLMATIASLAMALCVRESRLTPVLWFSLSMLSAVAYTSYLYVDSLSFFRILMQIHVGWWYPAILLATAAAIYTTGKRPDAADPESRIPTPG